MHFSAAFNPMSRIKVTEPIFKIVKGTDTRDIAGIKAGDDSPEGFAL
jgi:hypothetical protein